MDTGASAPDPSKEKCEEEMKKQPAPRRRNSNEMDHPNMSECEASAEKKKGETEEREQDVPSEIRLVLLGKTGSGKSAAGNTILGREEFKAMFYGSSVTKECGKKKGAVAHTNISVVDTPGLFDTDFTEHEVKKEILKCVALSAPGPHAFLLVVQLGRFTEEERRTVEKIEEIFGDRAASYTMVLFTYGDRLKDTTIEKYIEGAGVGLQQLVQRCGNRYHVFNNEETSNRTQVTELLNKIKTMVSGNGGSSYTNEMYQEVEGIIREKEKELKRHYEAELRKKKEELEAKFQKEIDELKEMKQKLDKLEEEMERSDERIKEMQEKHSQELEEFKRFYKDKDRNAREEAEKSNPILEGVRKVMKLFTAMEILEQLKSC